MKLSKRLAIWTKGRAKNLFKISKAEEISYALDGCLKIEKEIKDKVDELEGSLITLKNKLVTEERLLSEFETIFDGLMEKKATKKAQECYEQRIIPVTERIENLKGKIAILNKRKEQTETALSITAKKAGRLQLAKDDVEFKEKYAKDIQGVYEFDNIDVDSLLTEAENDFNTSQVKMNRLVKEENETDESYIKKYMTSNNKSFDDYVASRKQED